ncbi:MAG: FAD-dependent oxidoreductase [Betaproteobacteria bacterium]|nr:FAD-dependent oxidoreductase [Betaproteobacteria bacterium]
MATRPATPLERHYDVVIVGAGSSGVAAAVAAARNGANTLLVDAGPGVGGELLSGIPLLGCLNLRNQWVVGGVVRELLDECATMGGYIGPVSDFRTLNVVSFDPEIMKLAVVKLLQRHGVHVLLYTFAEETVVHDGMLTGLYVRNKMGRTLITAKVFIDCSGDGDIAVSAGAPFESGDAATGSFQAMTMVFRMVGVETPALLEFIASQPDSFGIKDHPVFGMTQSQCVAALIEQGQPKCAVLATGPLLRGAIESGAIYPISAVAIAPVSTARREVSINATRIANLDATNTEQLSAALPALFDQVAVCMKFLTSQVPGFVHAEFSGVAPRIGIRETRRVLGDYVLTGDDVLQARKHPEGIARGGHEIDVHGAGTGHDRRIIGGGGSYDIPFGALIPRGLDNVLLAGRCLSSTREGQSSARVMGTCMAMGQAAGTAAALVAGGDAATVRTLPVGQLRAKLIEQGAVLAGVD